MKKFHFILGCLLMPLWGISQHFAVGSPIISHFEKSDYHAGTQNWAAIQDGRGIMYFGNNKGLLEFDGTSWRTYQLPNHTIVRSLATDLNGRLYVGGQDELGYLNSDDSGNVNYISLTDAIPENYQSFADIWKIFVLGQQIFFCSQRAIFLLEAGELVVVTPENKFETFFECQGKFFVQDNQLGLLVWDQDHFIPVPQGRNFAHIRLAAILPYQKDQYLLVSTTQGLFLMDDTQIIPWDAEVSSFLATHQAYSAVQLSGGRYAIGTAQNGLVIIDADGTPAMHLNQANGLQNNTVLCIFHDKHKNLWLGLDNGIDYVESSAPFSIIGNEEGVEGTGYVSVIHQGKLYLGTNQGLYTLDWPKNENPFKPGKFQAVKGIRGQVWSLNKLGDDLIVGLHEGACQIRQNQVIPLSTVEGAWKFVQFAQHPNYAIEGTYSGLYLYERQAVPASSLEASWKMIQKLEGFDESARVIEEDEAGHIWVSHAYKGLYKISLDLPSRTLQEVAFYDTKDGLPTAININVAKVRRQLIFTTPQCIYQYDEASNRFVKSPVFNPLFGEQANIHRLLEDQTRNIWFSVNHNFGLLKVKEQGVFNQVDKIYFNQLQEKIMAGFENVYAYDRNNVFIATENGFIHYDPSSKKDFQLPFQTIIRSVTSIVEGDSIIFGGSAPGVALDTNAAVVPFQFSNKLNDFRFSFSTPFYEQINHIEYRYRLEGFADNWSEWSTQTEKEYTNLPAGNYRFLVEARNAYAQTSSSDHFSFVIQPAWYNTTWAKTLFLLCFFALLFGTFNYFNRQTQQQQEQLKQEQTLKLQQKEVEFKKEVEKSEAEYLRLHNEKLLSEVNYKDSQLASATMHLVQKGEMLLKIKQELNKLLPDVVTENRKQVKKLIRTIVEDARLDDNWEQFEFHFDQVHENFLKRLREQYPMLTPKDQKICAYLRMNLSSKEIAPLMNISVRGVEISRYRLRRKLNVDADANLIDFMLSV